MNREEFIQSLKAQTSDSAIFGVLEVLRKPPGRKPTEQDARLSALYSGLSDSDRETLHIALKEAAELAVFSFLCVLDGVSAIEDSAQAGELRLVLAKEDGSQTLNAPEATALHEIYNQLCRHSPATSPSSQSAAAYATGSAGYLRTLLTSRDGLDIHAVGPNSGAPMDRPSIILPKAEHRKL